MGFLVYLSVVLLIVIVVAACLIVYATKRHKRYIKAVEVAEDAPPNVHLPGRADQDQAYRELEAWLKTCADQSVPTWVAGQSRVALLHRHAMQPWDRTITVHYVEPSGPGKKAPILPAKPKFLVTRRDAMAPASLKHADFGPVTKVPYEDRPDRTLRPCAQTFTFRRRDFLDYFRFPPAMSDTFTVDTMCD
jgi:hypothetical protein